MSHIKLLFIFVLSFFSHFSTAETMTDNDLINANYKVFSSGFEKLDLNIIDQIYADDAVYISETFDKEIVTGKENILSLYKVFFKKIAKKSAHIDVDFRVINRELTDENATDVGYYLVRFHPRKETGEPTSVFSGKFVLVSRKVGEQQWQFIVDSNTKVKPDFYFSAKPSSNLYYGRQFNPLIESHEETTALLENHQESDEHDH
ncbi:DUF4440 domain-containing protein [Shewanella electrodiphila]|uniref:DUF4440 domain-containing protein n=1 Tax=Shewanella electrodiphila TaxID=934143 RepID=A0ABT0KSP4_9GAMM|nr:DUF4440 domain-containing protein [Shewanella electrodiphila]MCL1046778.1 DUF4440 domain-containing protein [Shewanella electrodiphila]